MGESRSTHGYCRQNFSQETEKIPLGRPRDTQNDNIKMDQNRM